MKELVKVFSFVMVLAGIFPLFPLHSFAGSSPDDNGKLQLKTDRIGETDAERENLQNQEDKETESEKMASELFTEQTRTAIQSKQAEREKTRRNLEEKLFTMPIEVDVSVKDMEKLLFSSDYTVPSTATTNHQNKQKSFTAKQMAGVLIGCAAAGLAGIYMMARKMMG